MTRRKAGFTILELLIALAVFGVLASAAAYAINAARAAERDADRISDVAVLRSGLSQYWLRNARFPESEGVLLGAPDTELIGLTTEGFVKQGGTGTVILEFLPSGPKRNEYYLYKGTANGYSIRFETERNTAYGEPGVYYAHAAGVDTEDAAK